MSSLSVLAAILVWSAAQLASGGSVSGTIRLAGGAPAAEVKVMAMAVPGVGRVVNQTYVAERITQTDANGRYQLEDIPPGRYLIAAGPLTSPTFHPGTVEQTAASIVTVTRGGRTLTGIDFALNTFGENRGPAYGFSLRTAVFGELPCCRLTGQVVTEDGKPFPIVNVKVVYVGGGSNGLLEDRSFRLSVPIGSTAQFAVEGLPPGYFLKSVVLGGKDVGLGPVLIDGKSLATLVFTLGYLPASTLQKVTARGKIVNIARELSVTSFSLTSTNPSGPTVVAPLQPGSSFEFAGIPIGVYRAGVLNPAGNASVSSNLVVIRDTVSDLTIDLHNNPFPEFEETAPARSAFTDGKRTTLTGVVTQRVTRLGAKSQAVYFRIDVKDERTGVVTPWAIHAAQDWHLPNIIPGETLTVPGTLSTDGTNRLSAEPF